MKKILIIFLVFFLSVQCCCAKTVIYNTKTKKYHYKGRCGSIKNPNSPNYVKIERQDAISRGGIPCANCGENIIDVWVDEKEIKNKNNQNTVPKAANFTYSPAN